MFRVERLDEPLDELATLWLKSGASANVPNRLGHPMRRSLMWVLLFFSTTLSAAGQEMANRGISASRGTIRPRT